MKLGKVIDGYYNYTLKADENEAQFGLTPEYKFFDPKLNDIFCGGLSKPNATNIILIYGATGVGKSLFSLNIIASAIKEHKKFAHILLEDDPEESLIRLRRIIPQKEINTSQHILVSGESIAVRFTEEEALELFDDLYKHFAVDIIILDHIQFLFEATATDVENEWIRQRSFVQEINKIVKKYKKTIVLISHVKKGADMTLDSTTGSNSIPQVATKAIAIYRDESKQLCLRQEKSRYTKPYFDKIPIKFVDFKLMYNDAINSEKVNSDEL
jgi:RecA-family ATPase